MGMLAVPDLVAEAVLGVLLTIGPIAVAPGFTIQLEATQAWVINDAERQRVAVRIPPQQSRFKQRIGTHSQNLAGRLWRTITSAAVCRQQVKLHHGRYRPALAIGSAVFKFVVMARGAGSRLILITPSVPIQLNTAVLGLLGNRKRDPLALRIARPDPAGIHLTRGDVLTVSPHFRGLVNLSKRGAQWRQSQD
ncbi:MAG: hypothetical protein CVV09_13680 [Gammaproteobacteria bacterium HGW-Gammaproteobacteria-13]|nr:MAG: hypothetical protein CVV09_13680 [Gammaproteobacteria bacterium HGW-Gammaproteobacteria-13]